MAPQIVNTNSNSNFLNLNKFLGILFLLFITATILIQVSLVVVCGDTLYAFLETFADWIQSNIVLGLSLVFAINTFSCFLCLPMNYICIICGMVSTKILGIPMGLLVGTLICFLSNFIAGLLTFYLSRSLYFSCFRLI